MKKLNTEEPILLVLFGANGQLGRSFQEVYNIEARDSMLLYSINKEDCDLEKKGAVIRVFKKLDRFVEKYNYTSCIVINASAYTNVERAEEDVDRAFYVNSRAVDEIAREVYTRSWGMIHISTDYVFDGKSKKPYTTDSLPNPLSVYGGTKANGEKAIHRYLANGKGMLIRTSGLFSVYGNNFVKKILQLSGSKREIQVIDDQITCFTYAPHLAKYIFHCINFFLENGHFRKSIAHYVNKTSMSWYSFARGIIILADKKDSCKVERISTEEYASKVHRPAYSVLAIDEDFGDFYQLNDALYLCIELLRAKEPFLFDTLS